MGASSSSGAITFAFRGDIRYFRDLQDFDPDGNFHVNLGNVDCWRPASGITLKFLRPRCRILVPMARAIEQVVLEAAGREVVVTNPGKVHFPEAGIAELEVVRYYLAVAEGACAARAAGRTCSCAHPWRRGLLGIDEEGADPDVPGDPKSNLAASAVSEETPPAGPQWVSGLHPQLVECQSLRYLLGHRQRLPPAHGGYPGQLLPQVTTTSASCPVATPGSAFKAIDANMPTTSGQEPNTVFTVGRFLLAANTSQAYSLTGLVNIGAGTGDSVEQARLVCIMEPWQATRSYGRNDARELVGM